MQKIRHFVGSLPATTVSTRQTSYGDSATNSVNTHVTEIANKSVAEFLNDDCGVDAAYEQRVGSGAKFLWIYDVPFLWAQVGAATNIYGPYNPAILASASNASVASGNSTEYNFWLVFTGDPETAFTIRFCPYNTSPPTSAHSMHLDVMKAKNVLTSGDGMIWGAFSSGISGKPAVETIRPYYFCPAGESGMDWGKYERTPINALLNSSWTLNDPENIPGKIPLVPFRVGSWEVPGAYQYPLNFDIVPANNATVIPQAEMKVGDKRFLVTSATSAATTISSMLNLPLIELTDE